MSGSLFKTAVFREASSTFRLIKYIFIEESGHVFLNRFLPDPPAVFTSFCSHEISAHFSCLSEICSPEAGSLRKGIRVYVDAPLIFLLAFLQPLVWMAEGQQERISPDRSCGPSAVLTVNYENTVSDKPLESCES